MLNQVQERPKSHQNRVSPASGAQERPKSHQNRGKNNQKTILKKYNENDTENVSKMSQKRSQEGPQI